MGPGYVAFLEKNHAEYRHIAGPWDGAGCPSISEGFGVLAKLKDNRLSSAAAPARATDNAANTHWWPD